MRDVSDGSDGFVSIKFSAACSLSPPATVMAPQKWTTVLQENQKSPPEDKKY